MRIAVDAMGGDHAPREIVRGALDYAASSTDEIILVGDVPRLEREIAEHSETPPANVRLVDAPEVVGMGEHPATALRTKRRSSIVVATDLVRNGEADAIVSAGSTGATMAAAVFRLGRIEGIDRPALPAHMVTATGPVMLLDVGANVDSSADNLVQFAAMGAIFSEHVLHVANPRIGLLNIGEEVEKGDSLAREAHEKLAAANLRFVGNVEAHEMLGHRADVVVCDGFVGNIILKFTEGIAEGLFETIVAEVQDTAPHMLDQFKPVLKTIYGRHDWQEYGGAPLLGVGGYCMICHGRSESRAIKNVIRVGKQLVQSGVNEKIVNAIAKSIPVEE
jgi:phosphate acyltransferase